MNIMSLLVRLMLLWAVASSRSSLAQTPAPSPAVSPASSTPLALSFGRAIKHTIAVVYSRCEGDPSEYQGTAFYVVMEDPRLPTGSGFGYLVTNRHVAQPKIETGSPCKLTQQQIRFNSLQPDPVTGSRNLIVNFDASWTFPDDSAVDLAATPFNSPSSKIDLQPIPSSMFVTSDVIEREGISEGDSVVYTGYFYQYPGNLQIEPIVRQGIIAMMPEEPIMTTLGRPGRAYFADAHVFGGNSGSPMFVNLGGVRNGGMMVGTRYSLLGVVSGVELEDTDITLTPTTITSGKFGANSGISLVTPASQLLELLNKPSLASVREQVISRLPSKGVPATPKTP
jgi:hypothetical protein